MVEKKSTTRPISIAYEEAPDRPVLPVGGAIGGPAPDGTSIIAHLYNEFATIPTVAEHEMADTGAVDLSKGTTSTRSTFTRLVVATVVLSPEAAIRLGNWLVKHGADATKHRQKNQPKPDKS